MARAPNVAPRDGAAAPPLLAGSGAQASTPICAWLVPSWIPSRRNDQSAPSGGVTERGLYLWTWGSSRRTLTGPRAWLTQAPQDWGASLVMQAGWIPFQGSLTLKIDFL